jgi:peptidoglycan hydrolase CwlO-like protein
MKRIYAFIAAIAALLTTSNGHNEDLNQQIADRDKLLKEANEDRAALHAALDQAGVDNKVAQAALEASKAALTDSQAQVTAKQAELDAINADIDKAADQSDEVLAKITADQGIPVVVGENGGVVHDEEHPANNAPAPGDSQESAGSGSQS